jgi:hypothetical protein
MAGWKAGFCVGKQDNKQRTGQTAKSIRKVLKK